VQSSMACRADKGLLDMDYCLEKDNKINQQVKPSVLNAFFFKQLGQSVVSN
jgi:hypothetical protein